MMAKIIKDGIELEMLSDLPVDEQEEATISMIQRLWDQAETGLDLCVSNGKTVRDVREDGGRLYMGDHWDYEPRKGLKQFTINRTQNSIITTTAIQTEKTPDIQFNPVETDDPPAYFITDGGVAKVAQLIAQGVIPRGNIQPHDLTPGVQIDIDLGNELRTFTESSVDPETGEVVPGPLRLGEDLIMLNDRVAADAIKTIFDQMWANTFGDMVYTNAELLANIFGDQSILFEWDTELHTFLLTIPNYKNVRHDPTSIWVKWSNFEIHEQIIPSRIAKLRFPEFSDDIDQAQESNTLTHQAGSGRASSQYDAPFSHVDFQEPIVTLRTTWIRNARFKLNEEEAVEEGLVIPVDIEGGGSFLVLTDEDGNPTDKRVSPQSKDWPTKKHIRQIMSIVQINKIVRDEMCPFVDIPMVNVINIPIPFSPYGLGEPQRTHDIQVFINRLSSIMYNYFMYYQFPQEYWPKSLLSYLKEQGEETHAHPGRQIGIDDGDWNEWFGRGRTGFSEAPPPLPGSVVTIFEMMLNEHNRSSGQQDAIQGALPASGTSGAALELLQSAARGPIGFKAKYLEWAMIWIGRLAMNAIVEFLPDSEWDRYNSKYPAVIRKMIRDRARSLKYDVSVQVVSGRGIARQAETERAQGLFDRGVISAKDLLRASNYPEPEQAMARRAQEQPPRQVAPR